MITKTNYILVLIALFYFMVMESLLPPFVTSATTTTTANPFTTQFTTSQAPSGSCNQSVCDACPSNKYPVVNLTISDLVSKSPLIIHLVSGSSATRTLSSQCYTYLELYPDVYLAFITNTYKNGTISVNVIFSYQTPLGPGTYYFVGLLGSQPFTPAIAVGYVVKITCPGCSELINGITITKAKGCPDIPPFAPQVTFGPSAQPADCCLTMARNYFTQTLGDINVIYLPNKKPIPCVGSFYVVPVINAKSLEFNPDLRSIQFPLS